MKVLIDSIEKVKDFAMIANTLDTNVYVHSGRYIIDGKSIMGLFSLDLLNPLEIEFDEPEDEDEAKEFRSKVGHMFFRFLVEE